ncbi:phospholipid phosphatase 2-like isoform X1 [Saimiri boliviensis]|uniref:phospholipid phosphatase 2-like isoform X1 n=2 Tax=Saimiri boliviensis TaxID=27679 RepID=UPI003D782F17
MAVVYKVLGTFLFGAAVSQSLTYLAKYTIGHLHPNFLAICDPEWSWVNCSVYVQLQSVCRGNAAGVIEARYFRTARRGCTSAEKLSKSICAELCRHQRAHEPTPDQLPSEVPEDFLGAGRRWCQLSLVHWPNV